MMSSRWSTTTLLGAHTKMRLPLTVRFADVADCAPNLRLPDCFEWLVSASWMR